MRRLRGLYHGDRRPLTPVRVVRYSWRPMKRPPSQPRPWTTMHQVDPMPMTPAARTEVLARLTEAGYTPERIDEMIDAPMEMWRNDRYIATVDRRDDASVSVLSIRRTDRKPIRDWRHFQLIKNDIAGDDAEACELYPAEERLMDSANQYWLWVLAPGERWPFGFKNRVVTGPEVADRVGAKQRAHA